MIILRRELDQNPELIALLRDLNSSDQQLQGATTTRLSEIFGQNKEHVEIATQLLSSVSIESILGIDIESLEKLSQDASTISKPDFDLGFKTTKKFDIEIEKYSYNWRTGGQFAK